MAGPLLCFRSPKGQDVRMTGRARRSWFPGLLALIGGGAIVAGSLLTWLDVGGGVSVGNVSVTATPKGSELLLGQAALGAGVAVAILGLLLLVIRSGQKLLGFLVIVGGLVAIGTAAFVVSSARDRYIDFAVEKGAPAGQSDEVRASLANLFEVSGQEADLGVGLYVVIGGGVLSVLGGLTAVFVRRKSRPVEEAKEPSEPKPEGLPAEWLAARAEEAAARSTAAVEEPAPQVLVTQAASPPLPDPPPEPEETAPWRSPLPEAPESPPEEERVAPAEGVEAPRDAAEEPAPAPEPVTQAVSPASPSKEPAKPDVRDNWSRPLPDDWTAKPAKRRWRRRS
jgi:hypothetical protein